MKKPLSFLCALCISLFLLTVGCASKPVLQYPEPLPPIVKEFKTVTVHGQVPGMQNTGVYLEKNDFYSMFGSGTVRFHTEYNERR